MSPRAALNRLLRRGTAGRDGLDALRRRARERARELRRGGRLDGTLEQVSELLDQALEEERRALFPIADDSARMAEAELDTLPNDTARAVRQLADYQWRSPEARQTYEQIQELLRSEVLDAQFAGMRDALQNASPEDLARVRDDDERAQRHARRRRPRRAHRRSSSQQFMQQYGDFFPENPQNLDELIDALARRAAAAQQLMDSLTPEQRAELGNLMANAMGQAGLADEMARLQAGPALGPSGPAVGRAPAHGRRRGHGLLRRHRRAGRARRPRPARRAARPGLPRRRASTTSTRS